MLDQNVFDYLLNNSNHTVDLTGNKLFCQFGNYSSPAEHPYYWIYENRAKLSQQMYNATCSDNSDLFQYLERQFSMSSAALLHPPRVVTLAISILGVGVHLYHFSPFIV